MPVTHLVLGDCVEVMQRMAPASIDAVVCDPPYGLEFMGKGWDKLDGDVGPGYTEKPRTHVPSGDWGSKSLSIPNYFVAGERAQRWHESWARECLRVLKPGGHLIAFGGSRTYHRLACAIEDAGFEIRDQLQWLYGQGFPKSMDVSKAIDKHCGVKGSKGLLKRGAERLMRQAPGGERDGNGTWGDEHGRDPYTYVAGSAAAEEWNGWGTALKPAHEPIVLARKPLIGTVAKNVLEYGTGALNIDASRINADAGRPARVSERRDDLGTDYNSSTYAGRMNGSLQPGSRAVGTTTEGRFPANVLLGHHPECVESGTREVKTSDPRRADGTVNGSFGTNGIYGGANSEGMEKSRYGGDDGRETVSRWACVPECPVRLLDMQTGTLKSGQPAVRRVSGSDQSGNTGSAYGSESRPSGSVMVGYGDLGGASRFFYCAKASTKERGEGVSERNDHPTVKPLALMRYLCILVTPPDGTILDPFVGSGTTAVAADQSGFNCIGIERDEHYFDLAVARVIHWRNETSHLSVFDPRTAEEWRQVG